MFFVKEHEKVRTMSASELFGITSRSPFDLSDRHNPLAVLAADTGFEAPPLHAQLFVKRVVDIVVAALAIAALSPLLIFCAIAIKLESPGPVFFRQLRWGKGGKKITVLKFRSMRADLCDASGVKQTVRNDPRITRVGDHGRNGAERSLPRLWFLTRRGKASSYRDFEFKRDF